MKYFLPCFFTVLLCVFLSSAAQAELKEHHFYRVSRVVDGDTIKLNTGETVRLIGIDTPEIRNDAKFQRDLKERHLSKAAELAMGKRACKFTKKLIEGKQVHLKFDKSKYDDYHRALAYVFLSSGTFVNAEIIKDGYAYPYPVKPDLQYAPLFRHLYQEAQNHHRGLWKEEKYSQKRIKWVKN